MSLIFCRSVAASILFGSFPVLCAQSPVATLSCTSPSASLTLPLLADAVFPIENGESSVAELEINTAPDQFATLLASSLASPTYSTCMVSGGVLSYTLTGVSFDVLPGLEGGAPSFVGPNGNGSTIDAFVSFVAQTLTIGGAAVPGTSQKRTGKANLPSKGGQR